MKKVKGMKYYFITAAIALLAVFVAAPVGAWDLNWKLRGDYTYSDAATCVFAPCGIDTTTGIYDCQTNPGFQQGSLIRLNQGRTAPYNAHGVIHFNGHGKFTFEGEVTTVRTSPPPLGAMDIPVNQSDLNCDGNYRVDSTSNGLFVDIIFANCTVEFKGPILVDWAYKITFPIDAITFRGRLDTVTGSNVLFFNDKLSIIEEGEYTGGPYVGAKEQRICSRTVSMVKLSPWRYWFSNEQTDLPKPKK